MALTSGCFEGTGSLWNVPLACCSVAKLCLTLQDSMDYSTPGIYIFPCLVEWHHQLDGHGSGWTLAVGDGQGGLACCGSWGHRESDMTERLN